MLRNIFIALLIVIALPVLNMISASIKEGGSNDVVVVNFEEIVSENSFEENLESLNFEDSNIFSAFED